MQERMHSVHHHIAQLHAEAAAERVARDASGRRVRHLSGGGLRRRVGRALIALGALLEGPDECEPCPDGMAAPARP